MESVNMNQLYSNGSIEPMEELRKLIDNINKNLDIYENAEKFVKVVDKNKLDQQEVFRPLLLSFCDALREKGYPVVSDTFAEKWHIK
jgi:hypothetical protein